MEQADSSMERLSPADSHLGLQCKYHADGQDLKDVHINRINISICFWPSKNNCAVVQNSLVVLQLRQTFFFLNSYLILELCIYYS